VAIQDCGVEGGPPIISLKGLRHSFDNGNSFALKNVDLAIEPGAFVALVGGSGSGKTTLLKCINRLIDPLMGSVEIEGQSARDLPGRELRRKIGYAFQGVGLFPHMTVAENIGITPSLLGWSRPEIASRVEELLTLVELPPDYAGRSPDQLSGGQRQRVGVARALAARPHIMLMDEPFGALDPVTRDTLGVAYRQLHDQIGLTTVMVTHDILEAVLLADRIIVVHRGEVIADGAPNALLTTPQRNDVQALMDMPRRQAERVHDLLHGEPAGQG